MPLGIVAAPGFFDFLVAERTLLVTLRSIFIGHVFVSMFWQRLLHETGLRSWTFDFGLTLRKFLVHSSGVLSDGMFVAFRNCPAWPRIQDEWRVRCGLSPVGNDIGKSIQVNRKYCLCGYLVIIKLFFVTYMDQHTQFFTFSLVSVCIVGSVLII